MSLLSRAGVVIVALVLLAAAPAGASSSTPCDSSGLRASHGTGRVHIVRLTVKGASCAAARGLAGHVAKRYVSVGPGDAYPSRVDGYSIAYGDPICAACTQQERVTAKRGATRIAFRIDIDHE